MLFRDTPVETLTPNRAGDPHPAGRRDLAAASSAKVPGPQLRLGTVNMDFDYADYFGVHAEHRLRDAALRLHDRRRHAVPARRHGRGRAGPSCSRSSTCGARCRRATSQLRGGHVGTARKRPNCCAGAAGAGATAAASVRGSVASLEQSRTAVSTLVIKPLPNGVRVVLDPADQAVCLNILHDRFERNELDFVERSSQTRRSRRRRWCQRRLLRTVDGTTGRIDGICCRHRTVPPRVAVFTRGCSRERVRRSHHGDRGCCRQPRWRRTLRGAPGSTNGGSGFVLDDAASAVPERPRRVDGPAACASPPWCAGGRSPFSNSMQRGASRTSLRVRMPSCRKTGR